MKSEALYISHILDSIRSSRCHSSEGGNPCFFISKIIKNSIFLDPLVKPEDDSGNCCDSINTIEEFISEYDSSNFADSRMRYDAVLRNLQTMAEATQKLTIETKNRCPQIPWRDISGFRNILVHDYLEGIDTEIIWSVILKEPTILKVFME